MAETGKLTRSEKYGQEYDEMDNEQARDAYISLSKTKINLTVVSAALGLVLVIVSVVAFTK